MTAAAFMDDRQGKRMSKVLTVTGADVDTVARALETLGLRLLRHLLERGRAPAAGEWLTRAEVRLLDRLPARQVGWRRALARMHPALERRVGIGSSWASRVHVTRHAVAGWRMPDRLIRLAAHRAWESPTFRRGVARRLTAHLRRRLVVPLLDLPPPRLQPAVVWLLVASVPLEMPLLMRAGVAFRRRRRAIVRLRQLAAAMVARASMPDDFWTDWLVWVLQARGASLPAGWTPRIDATALSLPVAGAVMTEDVGETGASSGRPSQAEALATLYDAWCLSPQGVAACSASAPSSRSPRPIERRSKVYARFRRRSKASSTTSST